LPGNGKTQQWYAVVAVQRKQWELFLCGQFPRQQLELSFSLWSDPRLYNQGKTTDRRSAQRIPPSLVSVFLTGAASISSK
jgi:hypothetical protein